MPSHSRMRAFDRDLIRGGHYGQRPCVPRLKAEHMAAPTNAANVKKALANSEPSTLCRRPQWVMVERSALLVRAPSRRRNPRTPNTILDLKHRYSVTITVGQIDIIPSVNQLIAADRIDCKLIVVIAADDRLSL